jgi:hypothetical protein
MKQFLLAFLLFYVFSDLVEADEASDFDMTDSFSVEGQPRLLSFNNTEVTIVAKILTGLIVTGAIYAYLYYTATVILERSTPDDYDDDEEEDGTDTKKPSYRPSYYYQNGR